MANSKKLDTSKLTLGTKKEVLKNEYVNIEPAINQIHNPVADKPVPEITRRTTVDIPESLHKKIKKKLVDKDQTIKDYFLELAAKDLGLQ